MSLFLVDEPTEAAARIKRRPVRFDPLGFEQPAHGIEPVPAILSGLGELHEMQGDIALGPPCLRGLRLGHALEQRGRDIDLSGDDCASKSGATARDPRMSSLRMATSPF